MAQQNINHLKQLNISQENLDKLQNFCSMNKIGLQ